MIMSSDNEPHSNQQTQILNPNENNNRRQRKRSVFDLEQVRQLEYVFNQITHYPDLPLRQQLTLLTELPDKKVQIWFQNRRAKWRKQHQLGHFGGLHELALDGQSTIVPAPKSNFILSSPSSTVLNNASLQQQQQLGYLFYLALQTAMITKSSGYSEGRYSVNHI